jgi:hypothetical protein
MSVPAKIRKEIRERLWAEADRLNWVTLSAADKSRYYTIWTEIENLGGRLGQYMDPRRVRVYIKDTLLKAYARESSATHDLAFRVLGIPADTVSVASYIKPHGRLLVDQRQIAWSKSSEWKVTLMALHERAFENGIPFGAVLTGAGPKYSTEEDRAVVESAAHKLGIRRVVWLD